MAIKGIREITAIATLLVANAFFGVSDKTTAFIFPSFGEEVFIIINFYTNVLVIVGLAFGLVILYRHIANKPLELPVIPSTPVVILNYVIFLGISYIILTWFMTGSYNLPIPDVRTFVDQIIIASNENTLSFIFLVTIFPFTSGVGDMRLPTIVTRFIPQLPWNIVTFGEYKLNFNPPNLNRLLYGFYGITIVTALHAGAYSFQVATSEQFYISLLIAYAMFWLLFWIKESFGFGACIAIHHSWNMVLISIRGSVF